MSRNKNKNKPWRNRDDTNISLKTATIVENFYYNQSWKKLIKVCPFFTIYFTIREYPSMYVVSLNDGLVPLGIIAVKESLEDAEAAVPRWFYRKKRCYDDQRSVVEYYFEKERRAPQNPEVNNSPPQVQQ